jgi:hypothetical protein
MMNRQKVEFIIDIFRIQSFWGRHGFFFGKNLIHTGRSSLSRNSDPATGHVSDSRNSQIVNPLETFDGPPGS